jgi:hypothetical protein
VQDFPRGYLNNNPGQIKRGADGLPGQRMLQTDREQLQFATPADGIRAMALTLRSYKTTGIDRLDAVIAHWARDSPVDAAGYAAAVAADIGCARDDRLDLDDQATLVGLVKAMMRRELGADYYDDREIADGVARAFDVE